MILCTFLFKFYIYSTNYTSIHIISFYIFHTKHQTHSHKCHTLYLVSGLIHLLYFLFLHILRNVFYKIYIVCYLFPPLVNVQWVYFRLLGRGMMCECGISLSLCRKPSCSGNRSCTHHFNTRKHVLISIPSLVM